MVEAYRLLGYGLCHGALLLQHTSATAQSFHGATPPPPDCKVSSQYQGKILRRRYPASQRRRTGHVKEGFMHKAHVEMITGKRTHDEPKESEPERDIMRLRLTNSLTEFMLNSCYGDTDVF